MVSTRGIASASRLRREAGAEDGTLLAKLNQMMEQIIAEKQDTVKDKLKRNRENVELQAVAVISEISRRDLLQTEENTNHKLLSRINNPLCDFRGFPQGLVEKDPINSQDIIFVTTAKIPYLKRLPPYRSWVHMSRNQRMPEDESVAGKKQIYYDQHGGETKIFRNIEEELEEAEEVIDESKERTEVTDELKEQKEVKDELKEQQEVKVELKELEDVKDELSEPKGVNNEPKELNEVKHEFSEDEDRLLWMAFEEFGLQEEVLSTVTLFLGGTISEVQERYEILKEKNTRSQDQHSEDSGGSELHAGICLEKSLSAALNSFSDLFCRRCLQVFDCPLHGSSQPVIYPGGKQPVWSEPEGDREPCSDQCFLLLKDVKILFENSSLRSIQDIKIEVLEEVEGKLTPSGSKELDPNSDVPVSKRLRKRKKVINLSHSTLCDSTLPPDDFQSSRKKLRRISDAVVMANDNGNKDLNLDASFESYAEGVEDGQKNLINEIEFKQSSNLAKVQASDMPSISNWKLLEKELCLKGVEMFGKNSCLIARNLLSGLKTCMEVAIYIYAGGESIFQRARSLPESIQDENEKTNTENKDQGTSSKRRPQRKRSKPKRFTRTRKPASVPSIWKRIAYGQTLCNKQYTPCTCLGECGKECPCFKTGSFCEKYCRCSKSCEVRFKGCDCEGQCTSRHCPCFAARHECDPDICLHCRVSCGDGSLGEPPGCDSKCRNLNLLSGQKQRVLLAKSDVAGWGAFTKNPIKKDACLGEYSGELITQREADRRGLLYDFTNSSFLFDLNNKYVVDAIRKGDKLKFANHSTRPNCYPKVVVVAGDHRIAIFAKRNLLAGVELFYDYRYDPELSPQWLLQLEGESSKKGASSKKVQSSKQGKSSKKGKSTVSQGKAKK